MENSDYTFIKYLWAIFYETVMKWRPDTILHFEFIVDQSYIEINPSEWTEIEIYQNNLKIVEQIRLLMNGRTSSLIDRRLQ